MYTFPREEDLTCVHEHVYVSILVCVHVEYLLIGRASAWYTVCHRFESHLRHETAHFFSVNTAVFSVVALYMYL